MDKNRPKSHSSSQPSKPTQTATVTRAKSHGVQITQPSVLLSTPSPAGAERQDSLDDGLSQLCKSIERMNNTITEMSRGLNDRLDQVDINTLGIQKRADAAEVTANARYEKLESLLTESKLKHTQTIRELRIVEAKLTASDSTRNKLLERMAYLENGQRMSNILIDGVPERDNENLQQYVLDLSNHLTNGLTKPASIVTVYRLGKKHTVNMLGSQGQRRPRTIKVVFSGNQERNTVYYPRANLKGNIQYKGVFINDDVTIDTKKARDHYRSVANLARSQKCEVKIHDDGVVIDGHKYRLFESETLPERFSLERAKTVIINDAVYFQSEFSFLSNFYPSPILVDNVLYLTAEHRFQGLKGMNAKNESLVQRIVSASTPQDAKKLGDSIGETPEWRLLRDEVLKKVIDEKFTQNPELADRLVETGNRKLNEATASNYYGVGAALHSREVRDGTHTGQNKLGIALENKRKELIANIDN